MPLGIKEVWQQPPGSLPLRGNRGIVTVSTEIVCRQLAAFQSEAFEIGLLRFNENEGKQMRMQTMTRAQIIESLPSFRKQNAHGWNVNIRPISPHSLTVIDDVSSDSIPRMKRLGFQPAMVVETSPDNHQVWLQHGRILESELASAVAKRLATEFGGDIGAASYRHFGKLAGFTNRKPKHRNEDGMYPFVRLLEATGATYTQAEAFILAVECYLEEQQRDSAARTYQQYAPNPASKTIHDFRNDPRYAGDFHRSDLAYSIYAAGHGIDEQEITAALATRDLSKKGSRRQQTEYIRRTIRQARKRVSR